MCDCHLIVFPILVPTEEVCGVAALLAPGQRSPDVSGQLRPALGEWAGIPRRHAPLLQPVVLARPDGLGLPVLGLQHGVQPGAGGGVLRLRWHLCPVLW